jgi:cysteine synthase
MEIRQIHVDRLETMPEEEINGRSRSMHGAIHRARQDKQNTQDIEIELCYFQRELEVRNHRRRAHQEWIRQFRR